MSIVHNSIYLVNPLRIRLPSEDMHRNNMKTKTTTIGKRKLELFLHGNNSKTPETHCNDVAHWNVPMNLYNNVINRRENN